MPSSLTADVLEQPHTARDYLNWVKELIEELKSQPDGLRRVRLREGLAKQLMQEALPIGIFASHFFQGSAEVEVELKIGSQSFDAMVRDSRAQPSGVHFLEVTTASEGEPDFLRMQVLHETGQVSSLGKVTKKGTKRTGRTIKVEAEAVSQQQVLERERLLISDAIERKLKTTYPKNTVLIIAFDDTMSFDRPDNQENIGCAVMEHAAALDCFHTVAVVGVVKRLFLSWSKSERPGG